MTNTDQLDPSKINRHIEISFQREIIHQFEGSDKNPQFATGGDDDVSFLAAVEVPYTRSREPNPIQEEVKACRNVSPIG